MEKTKGLSKIKIWSKRVQNRNLKAPVGSENDLGLGWMVLGDQGVIQTLRQ